MKICLLLLMATATAALAAMAMRTGINFPGLMVTIATVAIAVAAISDTVLLLRRIRQSRKPIRRPVVLPPIRL